MKSMKWLVSLALPLAVACSTDKSPTSATPTVAPPTAPPTGGTLGPVPGELIPGPTTGLLEPAADPDKMQRGRRRLDLDQLKQALLDATGERWMVERNGTLVERYDELAATLGKPDYDKITDEELDATVMFQRFLDDAARAVCSKLFISELTRASDDRIYFLHADRSDGWVSRPDAVARNLQYLLLRYHGRRVQMSGAGIDSWLWLFQQAEQEAGRAETAWNTVCVGLVTHPDFYTF